MDVKVRVLGSGQVEVTVPEGTVVIVTQQSQTTRRTSEEVISGWRPAPDSDPMYGGRGGGHSDDRSYSGPHGD